MVKKRAHFCAYLCRRLKAILGESRRRLPGVDSEVSIACLS